MRQIIQLKDLGDADTALWTRGNRPSQILDQLSLREAALHLKALLLLTDQIIGAGSYFFESKLTRELLQDDAAALLEGEHLLLYVNEEYGSFREHGLSKVEKNGPAFRAYADRRRVLELAGDLDRRAVVLQRPAADLSATIAVLWLADLHSEEAGSLGFLVDQLDAGGGQRWRSLLTLVAEERRGDFVWQGIRPLLVSAGINPTALRICRLRLVYFYNRAVSETISARADAGAVNAFQPASTDALRFDTDTLLGCFAALGVRDTLDAMPIATVLRLKRSAGWRLFHEFYRQLLEHAGTSSRVGPLASLTLELSNRLPQHSGLSRTTFVSTFEKMLSLANPRAPKVGYDLGDYLFSVAETYGDSLFELFGRALRGEQPAGVVMRKEAPKQKGKSMSELAAFIVHGHNDVLRLELKNYLQNTLGWPQPVILAEQPSRGLTVIEKFEELSQDIDVVVVLLTADDLMEGGEEAHPRLNVMFELGYFVGRLGRTSGRILLLKTDDATIPSDLAGVITIDVSRGVAAAGEEFRREVAGLTPLPSS